MAARHLTNWGLKPWVYENPQKYEPFEFEKLDGNELRYWARQQLPICAAICVVYYLFIHYGPLWMKNRKPFNLQTPLAIWNFLLAVFSIIATIRLFPEVYYALNLPNGFHRSTCELEGIHYPATFWGFAFAVSKIAELGDTIFIVLRKKPLIFLHWFHHLSMVLCTFYTYTEGEPYMRYCGLINYSVHSVMYSYYTIKALRIKVPKKVSMMVTSMQLTQFVAILSVNAYSFIRYRSGDCYRTVNSIMLTFALVGTYLYLFSKLFYNAYIAKPKEKSS